MALHYPTDVEDSDCILLFVPAALVPIIGALFSQLEKRERWATNDDYEQGYRAFTELQDQLMNNCMKTLIDEIRALRGVSPPYVDVPVEERTTEMYRSINDVVERLNTIIFGVTGGLPHDDNILLVLRGETSVDGSVNVLGELS